MPNGDYNPYEDASTWWETGDEFIEGLETPTGEEDTFWADADYDPSLGVYMTPTGTELIDWEYDPLDPSGSFTQYLQDEWFLSQTGAEIVAPYLLMNPYDPAKEIQAIEDYHMALGDYSQKSKLQQLNAYNDVAQIASTRGYGTVMGYNRAAQKEAYERDWVNEMRARKEDLNVDILKLHDEFLGEWWDILLEQEDIFEFDDIESAEDDTVYVEPNEDFGEGFSNEELQAYQSYADSLGYESDFYEDFEQADWIELLDSVGWPSGEMVFDDETGEWVWSGEEVAGQAGYENEYTWQNDDYYSGGQYDIDMELIAAADESGDYGGDSYWLALQNVNQWTDDELHEHMEDATEGDMWFGGAEFDADMGEWVWS